MEYNILIGGPAGSGMNTIANLIKVGLKRHGYSVYVNQEIMSRIRGGHNFFQIRFSNKEVFNFKEELDVIIAFDKLTIETHQNRLVPNGVILCDSSSEIRNNNIKYMLVNAKEIITKLKNPKALNIAILGSFVKLFDLDFEFFKKVVIKNLKNKNIELNLETFDLGYKSVGSLLKVTNKTVDNNIIISGNASIAFGAIAAGMSFYSAYPMTPATSVMTYLNKKQSDIGIIVEQAEDEISAIFMAMGASYSGLRAMTGSSGGGLSLMVEGIGLAAIAETPLVIVDVQRPGPATGMATKTSQSDLSFLLSASQDEFPRMIISIKDQEDAFYQTVRAFDMSDKYQIVVIILNDEFLADASKTIAKFDLKSININRYLATEEEINLDEKYKRYKFTETGVSPRILPGTSNIPIVFDSHEHDEYGNVVEDGLNRTKMHSKRLRKLDFIKKEMIEPEYLGLEEPEYVFVGFGSTYGAIKEAVSILNKEGYSVGFLQFGDVYPLPEKNIIKYSKYKLINVELNATGQLARLIKMETGISFDYSILKFDGRQISTNEIIKDFKEIL